jgi:hypothetical protein
MKDEAPFASIGWSAPAPPERPGSALSPHASEPNDILGRF